MAFTHGRAALIYHNGFDLSTFLNSVTLNASADTAETSTFGTTWKQFVAGLKGATFAMEGFYDGADDALIDHLNNALAATSALLWAVFPQGATVGLQGYGFAGFCTTENPATNLGGAAVVSANVQASGDVEFGVSLSALASVTGAGDGTAVDNATSSSAGASSYIHVTEFTGTDVTIKVQDSADDITYADLITHTEITAVNAVERSEVAGTVDRYTRYNVSTSGGFTSVTFAHLLCRL